MAGQTKYFLDSNSYLRLACSIHPLLSMEFGKEKHCLYVCAQLEQEYKWSARLKTKFHWVNEAKYIANRKRKINLSNQQKTEVSETVEFLTAFVLDMDFPSTETIPSEVDLQVLAVGSVLGIPVVTDDRAMHRVANYYGVAAYSTLELLKIMLDCGHIQSERIIEIGYYWIHEKDTPARFGEEWKRLFDFPLS